MKKYLLMFMTITFLLSSCTKNDAISEYATDGVIPEGWITEKQTISIKGKTYDITVATNPEEEGIKYLNSPHEVEQFFKDYEHTLIPHVIMVEGQIIVNYYEDETSFRKNVEFVNEVNTQTKSYNGATITVYKHVSSNPYIYGYGTAIQDKNTEWRTYWNLPSSPYNGVNAYGKRRSYVGSALNDEISAVKFYMNNASEPITFVGYKNSWQSYTSPPYTNDPLNCIVITKVPAAFGNTGQWVGTNTARLKSIRRGPFKTWNDCISGYEFWQNSTLNQSNEYIR